VWRTVTSFRLVHSQPVTALKLCPPLRLTLGTDVLHAALHELHRGAARFVLVLVPDIIRARATAS